MICQKNIYELFGVTGPVYPVDEIWYLGYHVGDPSFPYGGAPADVVIVPNTPAFSPPTISIAGGPQVELLSVNFGGFIPIPDAPNGEQGVLLSQQESLDFFVGQYCIPTIDSLDPYLEDGDPTQPGFYFFLRKVNNGSCTTFSQVAAQQVSIGAYLPEDIQVLHCTTDPGLDCYDITQYLDPEVTNTCLYPPYNPDYFDVPDPTCVDVSAGGLFTFHYIVPLQDLGLVFPVDPNCENCNEDDLSLTIEIIVGPDYEEPGITFCNN